MKKIWFFRIAQIVFLKIFILFIVLGKASAQEITIKNLKVTYIIDGDTIWVKSLDNTSFKIRLLGINAPEICTTPIEPYGIEAKQYVEKLLQSETVYIKYDNNNYKDKYNRILAHVYREKDNLWVNASLIEKGLAYVYILSSHILYLNELIAIEKQAIKNKTNIWNLNYYQPINPEEAKNFINHYKIIVGNIYKVSYHKNNIWLEFSPSNYQTHKVIKPALSINTLPFKLANNYKNNNNKTIFSAKISNILPSHKNEWNKYIGKIIVVRGYINQYNKNKNPYINIINSHGIEILTTP